MRAFRYPHTAITCNSATSEVVTQGYKRAELYGADAGEANTIAPLNTSLQTVDTGIQWPVEGAVVRRWALVHGIQPPRGVP
jgi:hypothetical protein